MMIIIMPERIRIFAAILQNTMFLLKGLAKGLEIIDPFLVGHGFKFEDFNINNGEDGKFAHASYINENKKFIIDYRFSIGEVLYQFEDSTISHPFYLDQLGFADRKLHKDFLIENNLEAFNYILHDFNFLIEDFFEGDCIKLIEFSKLQDKIITEIDRKIRKENSVRFDNIRIEKARQVFRNKDFKKCLAIYKAVDNKNLFEEIDNKVIEYCKRHV